MTRKTGLKPLAAAHADSYRVEEQIGFNLRRAHQRASLLFEEVMGRFDITPQQFTALVKLDDVGQASQNELGRMVAMDPATTFGVISRLKKQNLITQRADPADGRRVRLNLTAEGATKVAQMRAVAADVTRRTLEPLSPSEARTLLRLLDKIC